MDLADTVELAAAGASEAMMTFDQKFIQAAHEAGTLLVQNHDRAKP